MRQLLLGVGRVFAYLPCPDPLLNLLLCFFLTSQQEDPIPQAAHDAFYGISFAIVIRGGGGGGVGEDSN